MFLQKIHTSSEAGDERMKLGILKCLMCESPQRKGMKTCSHECSAAYRKAYQKAYQKAYMKAYRKTDKYKAHHKAYMKAYYQRKKMEKLK